MIKEIFQYTIHNTEIMAKYGGKDLKRQYGINHLKVELKAFFGLFYLVGVFKSNNVNIVFVHTAARAIVHNRLSVMTVLYNEKQ